MTKSRHTLPRLLVGSALSLGLIACGGGDNDDDTPAVIQEFQVDVINLTAGQPFSPIAMVVHSADISLITIGEPASEGLEVLAEGGDNSMLIAEADASDAVLMTLSGDAPVPPGGSDSFTLMIEESALTDMLLSGISMLVNTNDAVTAATGISLEGMEVGDNRSLTTISYDTGTEANSEFVGTIPGPADGGEGFNEVRDDIADEIRMHSGVITFEGGLTDSRLTEIHRWDNPVARVIVTRTQ